MKETGLDMLRKVTQDFKQRKDDPHDATSGGKYRLTHVFGSNLGHLCNQLSWNQKPNQEIVQALRELLSVVPDTLDILYPPNECPQEVRKDRESALRGLGLL